jgi:hypothetical protein
MNLHLQQDMEKLFNMNSVEGWPREECWAGTQFGGLEPLVTVPVSQEKNQTGIGSDFWNQPQFVAPSEFLLTGTSC